MQLTLYNVVHIISRTVSLKFLLSEFLTSYLTQYLTKPSPERVVQVPGPERLVRVPLPVPGPVRLVHVEPPSVPKKRIGLGTNNGKSAGKSYSVLELQLYHKLRHDYKRSSPQTSFLYCLVYPAVRVCVCLCVHVTTGVLLKRSPNTSGMILVEEIVPGFACGKAPFSKTC